MHVDGDLDKLQLQFGHEWVIRPHQKQWDIIIYAVISNKLA